jgi:V8-like Glu-specific endopeptidase
MQAAKITTLRSTVITSVLTVVGCGGGSGETIRNEPVANDRAPIVCTSESRVQIPNFNYPRASLGAVQSGGAICGGTMLTHNKVLTSQHCLFNQAPNGTTFLPHANIPTLNANYGSATSIRYVAGRDPIDVGQYADWAIVTFGTDLATLNNGGTIPFQTMARVIPTGTLTVSGYGYPGATPNGIDWSGHATEDLNKTMTVGTGSNPMLFSNLDVEHGNSGGPWWNLLSANNAAVYGTVADSSGSAELSNCAGTEGNHASNGLYFAFAPDNAAGIATANTGNGRLVTFATDMDWTLVASRAQLTTSVGSAFSPWDANDSAFNFGGRRLTALNLQDNRIELFVVTSTGSVKTRWQNTVDGSWSGWVDNPVPVAVKDIAASGGNGNTSHLFVLGTDNSVRYTYKTGDSNSAWAGWSNLGAVPGATALSAVRFPSVHEVFVASNTTSVTAWGNGGSFTSLVDFGAPAGGLKAIASGVLRDGRVSVMGYGPNGTTHRTRALDGSSWTGWNTAGLPTFLPTPIPNPNAFVSLSLGRGNGGSAKLFGIGSDGEIFTLDEQATADTFGDLNGWRRFYE